MKWTLPCLVSMLTPTAVAQSLPPIPEILLNSSVVACIRIAQDGSVGDAFLVTSTGDAARDRAAIVWVKQLRWDPAPSSDLSRNRWTPMPIAFGIAKALPMPGHCEPAT